MPHFPLPTLPVSDVLHHHQPRQSELTGFTTLIFPSPTDDTVVGNGTIIVTASATLGPVLDDSSSTIMTISGVSIAVIGTILVASGVLLWMRTRGRLGSGTFFGFRYGAPRPKKDGGQDSTGKRQRERRIAMQVLQTAERDVFITPLACSLPRTRIPSGAASVSAFSSTSPWPAPVIPGLPHTTLHNHPQLSRGSADIETVENPFRDEVAQGSPQLTASFTSPTSRGIIHSPTPLQPQSPYFAPNPLSISSLSTLRYPTADTSLDADMIRSPPYAVHNSRPTAIIRGDSETGLTTSASNIHIAQDAAPTNNMTSYSDDGMSARTSSTLPPSYHTRHSLFDPLQHPPALFPSHYYDGSPRIPPSAYEQNNISRQASALLATEDADGQMPPAGPDDRTTLAPGISDARSRRRTEMRVGYGFKSLSDGGVRLVESSAMGARAEPVRVSMGTEHEGSTRPPSYNTDET
ncbi:hypothetical protein C8Q76DRAFT_859589 [Earliella scabrosa]|nr:hypothetical protein C8Q76DRAFT_859589 [Earliella scabrosa]